MNLKQLLLLALVLWSYSFSWGQEKGASNSTIINETETILDKDKIMIQAQKMTIEISKLLQLSEQQKSELDEINRRTITKMELLKEKYQANTATILKKKNQLDFYRDNKMLQILTPEQVESWSSFLKAENIGYVDSNGKIRLNNQEDDSRKNATGVQAIFSGKFYNY